jgi:hypothetical protein
MKGDRTPSEKTRKNVGVRQASFAYAGLVFGSLAITPETPLKWGEYKGYLSIAPIFQNHFRGVRSGLNSIFFYMMEAYVESFD